MSITTNTSRTATAPSARTIPRASQIIARASLSILKDTRPQYTRQDQHDLSVLREYGF